MKNFMPNPIGVYTLIRREVERTFRVVIQTVFSPLVSATLFIVVFGHVVGSRIDTIGGVSYLHFVFPGILAMNVLTSAFSHASSAVYFARFVKSIQEILVAPLSYMEMIAGYVISAIVRGVVVGAVILAAGLLLGAVSMHNVFLFVVYLVAMCTLFALLGIITGLASKNFEQLNILSTFVIMPFSFLGGMFYTLDMLPPAAQTVTLLNPFFYMIDGIRYSMTGIHSASLGVGALVIGVIITALFILVWRLFSTGWRIRE